MIAFVMLPPFHQDGFSEGAGVPIIDLDECLLQRVLIRQHTSKGSATQSTLNTYAPDYVRVKMLVNLCRVDGDVVFTGRLFFSNSVLSELQVVSEVDDTVRIFGLICDPDELKSEIPDDTVREYECIQRVSDAMELCGGSVIDDIHDVLQHSNNPVNIDEVMKMVENMNNEVGAAEAENETALEKALRQARERIMANGGTASATASTPKKSDTKKGAGAKKKDDVTDNPTQADSMKKSLEEKPVKEEKPPKPPKQQVAKDETAPPKVEQRELNATGGLVLSLRLDIDGEYDIAAEIVSNNVIDIRLTPKGQKKVSPTVEPVRVPIKTEEKQAVKTTPSTSNNVSVDELTSQKAELDEQIRQARADGDTDTVNELRKERRKLREKIRAAGGKC